MALQQHKSDWDAMGELDPLWAILSTDSGRYGKWDVEEFFRTGEAEIRQMMDHAAALGRPSGRGLALDFGCGVGRLSRALAAYFDQVVGVDISESMIERARELNAAYPACSFVLNTEPDLRLFPDAHFDMIYTNIVLQHVPSQPAIRSYIAEFVRVIRPGGLMVFQLPSHIPLRRRLEPRRRLYHLLRRLGVAERVLYQRLGLFPISMNAIPREDVLAQLKGLGGQVLDVQMETRGPYQSATYWVTR